MDEAPRTRWDSLLAVQELDTAIDQLEHRRRTLPERAALDAASAALTKLERRVGEVEATRAELVRSQKRLEDEIESMNAKAAQHDRTLYSGTVSNPRELQAIQEEIGALKRRVRQLEDQQLELMEQIEPVDADLASLAAERTELDERSRTLLAVITESEVAIDGELADARGNRLVQAAEVEPDLLTTYDELRAHSGGVAIARLVNGHCGGCHLALSAVERDRIKRLAPEEAAHCEECGRLLAR